MQPASGRVLNFIIAISRPRAILPSACDRLFQAVTDHRPLCRYDDIFESLS